MKNITKYFAIYSILIGIMCCSLHSCQSDNNKESVSQSSTYSYKDEIKKLNNKYAAFIPSKNTLPHKKNNSDVNGWSVAAADAAGALTTSLETFKRTKNPGVSVGVGIIGGATASLAEYYAQRTDSTNDAATRFHNDTYALDLRHPINTTEIRKNESWFSDSFFDKAGIFHNYLVKLALLDPKYTHLMEKTTDNIFGDLTEILSSEKDFCDYDLWEGYHSYSEVMSYNYGKDFLSLIPEECAQYFYEYLAIAESLPANKCYDYTQEYIQTLSKAYETNSEIEYLLPLGVGIEVWYYSKSLWNYSIPRPNQTSTLLLQLTDNEWFITHSQDRIGTFLTDNKVLSIGVPKFRDNHLTEIFFFDNIEDFLIFEGYSSIGTIKSDFVTIAGISTDIDVANFLSIPGIYIVNEVSDDASIRYISIENGKVSM